MLLMDDDATNHTLLLPIIRCSERLFVRIRCLLRRLFVKATHLNGAPNRPEYRIFYFSQEEPGPATERGGHTRRDHGGLSQVTVRFACIHAWRLFKLSQTVSRIRPSPPKKIESTPALLVLKAVLTHKHTIIQDCYGSLF